MAFFVAPKILGSGLPAIEGLKSREVRDGFQLEGLSASRVGDDWLLEARVRQPSKALLPPLEGVEGYVARVIGYPIHAHWLAHRAGDNIAIGE